MSRITINYIRAFSDNYIWCIQTEQSNHAVIVDPGDAAPVQQYLQQHGLELAAILITHHHFDHVGGISRLIEGNPDISVFGPANESIPLITQPVQEGDRVKLEKLSIEFQVLEVPGHTAGHIAYYGYDALFCGDTVFAGGCGRVFDGTFEQLAVSLQRIRSLPAQTRIYCAHEYTVANLGFAKWVEPENTALRTRDEHDTARALEGSATVPSTLALELETNPFLRCDQADVIAAAERYVNKKLADYSGVFTAIRQWKDKEYD